MEETYLPKHLLMPFFDGKIIFYIRGKTLEQKGWLGLTVFGNGSVSLHLYSTANKHGVSHSNGETLTNDMLDKIFWNEERKAFVGVF